MISSIYFSLQALKQDFIRLFIINPEAISNKNHLDFFFYGKIYDVFKFCFRRKISFFRFNIINKNNMKKNKDKKGVLFKLNIDFSIE